MDPTRILVLTLDLLTASVFRTQSKRENLFLQMQEKSNVVPLKMVAMNISDRAQRSSKVDQVSQEDS